MQELSHSSPHRNDTQHFKTWTRLLIVVNWRSECTNGEWGNHISARKFLQFSAFIIAYHIQSRKWKMETPMQYEGEISPIFHSFQLWSRLQHIKHNEVIAARNTLPCCLCCLHRSSPTTRKLLDIICIWVMLRPAQILRLKTYRKISKSIMMVKLERLR